MLIKPEDILLNCSTFDKEHIMLVNLVNGIYKLLKEQRKKLAMEVFHDGLIAYTNSHLSHEEEVMKAYNYPQLDMHLKAHEVFKKIIAEDLAHFDDLKEFSSKLGLSMSWIFNHIKKTDRKYVEYFKEKGVYEKACCEESASIDEGLENFLKELLNQDYIST